MASLFQILNQNKTKNLSLGFRVGKFRDGGLLNIVHIFFQILNWNKNLILGFRVGNFRDSGPVDVIYDLYFCIFDNLSLGFRVRNFRDSGLFDTVYGSHFPYLNFK